MVQILKSPGFGTRVAESLGTGLSQLANSKLQQIQQQHQRQALQSGLQGLGLSPQMAQAYGSLPESALGPLLKQQMRMQSINDVLSGNEVQSGQQQDNSGMLRQLLGNTDQSGGNLGQVSNQSQQPRGKTYTPEQLTKITAIDPALGNSLRGQQAQQETERHNAEVEDVNRKKLVQGERRIENEEEGRNYETNKEYINSLKLRSRVAHDTINDNEQIIKIIDSGKWGSPKLRSILSKAGFEVLLNSPTSEAAKDLANKQVFDMVRTLGARNISDYETRQLQSLYPNLLQSAEGAKFIAENLILKARSDQQEKKIADQILKENKNKTPRDFETQIQERMEPYRAEYKEKFDANLQRVLNREQDTQQRLSEESFDNLPKDAEKGDRYINDNGKEVEWTGSNWKTV